MKKAMALLMAAALATCISTAEAAVGSSDWFFVDTTDGELTLAQESANWSSGSITLCCTDVNTSGTAHQYTLQYYDENNVEWMDVDSAKNQLADAEGNVHLSDTSFSSRLDGILPVRYRVKDENGRISNVCVTRNRYALVVGIDKYSSKTLKELEGCVSDAKGWKNAFEDWGSCRLLSPPITDADATKENILEKLNDCAKQTKPGDTFFYAHSGHGDVGVLRTYKSTKVPNSQNITVGPEDITANEFAGAMKEFPKGAGVVVILDACSSGSIPFTNKRNQGILMAASPLPECRSFAESVMAAMNTSPIRLLSATVPSDEDGASYPKISSGDEIGWLTAVDALQDSRDGVFSHECLQIAGWRYGGADYDKDGMVDFHELGRFAEYWLGRTFDQYGMTPQTFSTDILSSICAGRVPSPGEYGTVSAPVIGTPVNGAYHVTFKWSAVAGANDYCIAWITNNFTNFCYSTTLSKKIGPFKPGTVVSAYVKATNPMDVSGRSEPATGVVEYNVAVEEQARECDWTSICPASVNPINSNGTIDYDKLDIDHDGDGMSSFHEFIAGSDPLDIQSKFMAQISMGETGEPIVEWSPDTPELRATRVYRILGKKSLMDAEWVDITDMDQSEYRFFKVSVELDDGGSGGDGGDNGNGDDINMDDFVIEQGVLQEYVGDASDVVIPSSVTSIGNYLFAGNTNLVSVTIPGSVTNIGDFAFAGCEGLTSVTFNGNAPTLGDSCFEWGAPSCTVYVSRGSSGWGVTIPGTWNGMQIEYADDGSGNSAPANDERANAEMLTGASGTRSFSTVDATVEDGEPIVLSCESASASVWFKWTAPIRGRTTFSTAGSDFDTVLGVYRFDTLEEVTFNDDADDRTSSCSFVAQEGQSYYVVVAGYDSSGTAALSWECIVAPANDARANAETLTGVLGTRSFSTVDATVESGEPIVLSCEYASASVWFKWTAPIRGRTTFSTAGSGFDTVLGVYRFDTLEEVTFNDDADDRTSRCSFVAQVGQTYYVVVAGYDSSGAAALSWECVEGGTPTFSIEDGVLTAVELNGAFDVTIPGTVREIGESAFEGCEDLVSVVMSNGVVKIDDYAFYDCSSLESVALPYGLTSIGEEAFAYCYELAAVTVPEGVTNIASGAFYYCTGLTNVALPRSLVNVEEDAFACCGEIESFSVSDGNPAYKVQDGMLLTKNGEVLLHGADGDVSIPSGVTRIANGAFASCVGLTNVTIPSSVASIGSGAFSGCEGLTNVEIPNSVQYIGKAAFQHCRGLADGDGFVMVRNVLYDSYGNQSEVEVPQGVVQIEDIVFAYRSDLTKVTIPSSVSSIGSYLFYNSSNLTNVTFEGNAPTVNNYSFAGVGSSCTVYVNRGSSGWGVTIPGTWNGLPIRYKESEE